MNGLEKKIKEAVEGVEPWQRIPTTVAGLFIVKTPGRNGSEGTFNNVMVEINPVNENGTPIKRRGIFLTNTEQLGQFIAVMKLDGTKNVLKVIEKFRENEKTNDAGKIVL